MKTYTIGHIFRPAPPARSLKKTKAKEHRPSLRITGEMLEAIGLQIGSKCQIKLEGNQIIITAA